MVSMRALGFLLGVALLLLALLSLTSLPIYLEVIILASVSGLSLRFAEWRGWIERRKRDEARSWQPTRPPRDD